MATVPDTIQGVLDFYAVRQPVWAANAAVIGITPAQAAQLETLLDDAVKAQGDAVAAKAVAKTATQQRDTALAALTELGAGLIALIGGNAKAKADDSIYSTAMLPIPGTGGGKTAPAMPANLEGAILNTGDVQLNWGSSGRNVFYTVWRRLSTQAGFTQIGATAARTFLDDAEGAAWAAYYIVAHRGDLSSEPSELLQVVLPGWQAQAA